MYIESEEHHRLALGGLQKLLVLTLNIDKPEEDPELCAALNILTDVLLNWEEKHYSIDSPTKEAAEQFRKEQMESPS